MKSNYITPTLGRRLSSNKKNEPQSLRDIEEYLRSKYYKEDYRSHFFGAKSCEMLATEILDLFGCCYVSVFEDNENGAEVMTGY